MRVLSRADVERLVSMGEAIDLMREVFAYLGQGRVQLPERIGLDLQQGRDSILFMPAEVAGTRGVGLKVVSVFPDNPHAHGLATINGVVMLANPDTGVITTLMDATYLTALRTGAVSGLATDLLAREDARVLTVFGAGVQARTQIEAVLHVRRIERVVVHALTPAHAEALAREISARYGPRCVGEVARTADAALRDADIVVTATTATVPIFDGGRLPAGAHVNAVGSFKPWVREVDGTTVQRSRLFVDQREAALKEAGDLIVPIREGLITAEDIDADLGQLVLGTRAGRRDADEITLFKSVGLAAEDMIVAQRVYEKARAAGVGLSIDAFAAPQTVDAD